MPIQWRMFFGHPYLARGAAPNLFLYARVTSDQSWVLIVSMETKESVSSTVRGSQRCLMPVMRAQRSANPLRVRFA